MAKKKRFTLPDPASEGAFDWTQEDIDAVLQQLGRMSVQGKFNPATWEGEVFKITLSDGREHEVLPRYFGMVYGQWLKLTGR